MTSLRGRAEPLYIYDVLIRVSQSERPRDARDRISLLTAAFMKVVDGVEDFKVQELDFDDGCMRVHVLAPRLRGLDSGRVVVDVARRCREPVTQLSMIEGGEHGSA